MAKKGNREKIKLVSTADTGHYYTTTKNKKTHPEKMEVTKFDPEGAQTRDLQGSQDQIALRFLRRKKPAVRRVFCLCGLRNVAA